MHFCEVCNYEIKLCKKNQHEGTNYHLDRLERKEHPENFEDEEQPDSKSIIHDKEYFQCYKCKLAILSTNWKKHCLTKEHMGKTKKQEQKENPLQTQMHKLKPLIP